MPYRGNGATPPWAVSTGPYYVDPITHQHGERITALESATDHHHERLEGLEEAAEELRRHASRSLGSVLEGWLPDLKWLLIILLLFGGKIASNPLVEAIKQAAGIGASGFGG